MALFLPIRREILDWQCFSQMVSLGQHRQQAGRQDGNCFKHRLWPARVLRSVRPQWLEADVVDKKLGRRDPPAPPVLILCPVDILGDGSHRSRAGSRLHERQERSMVGRYLMMTCSETADEPSTVSPGWRAPGGGGKLRQRSDQWSGCLDAPNLRGWWRGRGSNSSGRSRLKEEIVPTFALSAFHRAAVEFHVASLLLDLSFLLARGLGGETRHRRIVLTWRE
jgi:hypothetical protein